MKGICRAALLASSLRKAGKRSMSAAVAFMLFIPASEHHSQTWRQRQQNAFRAHASFGYARHPVVVFAPMAVGLKFSRRQMCLYDDRCALQRERIGDLLPEEATNFVRTYDLVSNGINRQRLVGITKPG